MATRFPISPFFSTRCSEWMNLTVVDVFHKLTDAAKRPRVAMYDDLKLHQVKQACESLQEEDR